MTGDSTDVAGVLGPTGTPRPVYPLIFSSDVEKSLFEGTSHGYIRLDGLAKLNITFSGALASNYVVNVVGYVAAQLNSDASGVVSKVLVSQ